MKLSRKGARRNMGESELRNDNDPKIFVSFDKITITSYNKENPQNESTYDYTIELSFQDLSNILKKIDEFYDKHPASFERIMGENTKTLFRLLMLSSGILNNHSTKEKIKNVDSDE